jgi:diacylglycerol kinase family enzyme
MYLLLVFNGRTAGNFNLATEAEIIDGKLDVIVFKAVPIIELLPLFIKLLKGEHLDSDKVVYFKTDEVFIDELVFHSPSS